MYKPSTGDHLFSFSRFINNAVPNLALGPRADDLTVRERDQLFEYQISILEPSKLRPLAFFMGGITANEGLSAQIHAALIKHEVLSASSAAINTEAITPKFAHQLSIISSFAQKKLVNLLLFWEEEQQRWRVLLEEEAEIKGMSVIEAEREDEGALGPLGKRLEEIEGMIRLKPSMRSIEVRRVDQLPNDKQVYGSRRL
ncbi:hypothetical protein BU16DRAFT_211304 [Lophium mytilinum]|uniref:Uncharacterized protein n=1 Tax=Lophium mytilinum TaxID=390894 RepID=A0A6A6RBE0_9PEZI|nr:hypothetical protein BU16DRAFT_211304 [Lophium mytilinum]